MDVLNPSPALLIAIGSMVVHADEYMSKNGHDIDRVTFKSQIKRPEVREWLDAMAAAALLPLKRNCDAQWGDE